MTAYFHEANKKVNSRFLSTYPHYVLPSFNVNESEDLMECGLEESIPYSCSLPVPIHPKSRPIHVLNADHEDPVLTLVKEKLHWNHDVKLHTDYFIKEKKIKHLEKLLKHAKKKGIASFQPREAEFINLFSKNPDEHFDGVYNWYYTGGCMDKLELNGTTIVVHVQGKKMDRVCTFSLKSGNKWQVDSDTFTVAAPSPNSPIYEVRCKNVNGNGVVGIRVRNGCCMYSMSSMRKMELMHRTVSSYPFTSLDVSKYVEGRYSTVTTEREINVWDAEAGFRIFRMTVPLPTKKLPDKWSCIRWSNNRCIVMTDRHYIQMVDTRKKDIIELFSPKKESHLLNECEIITLMCPSKVSAAAMYITTSHQVLLYDTRNTSKPLQHWSHLLRGPPLYGSIISLEEGKEAACFANQQLGEISMDLNNWCEEQAFIEYPVVALPNMKDALRAAHKHGLWLDPAIQQRVKLSWTGMTWLPPHKSKLTLLTINSVGDVFSQVLKSKKDDQGGVNEKHCSQFSEGILLNNYSSRDLKCLKIWEKNAFKKKKFTTLKATRRVNMKHVFKSLKNSSFVLGKPEECGTHNEDASPWKISKEEMFHYKDVMAPMLLQAWEIEDENEWHVDKDNIPDSIPESSQTSAQKVEAWLNMSHSSSSEISKNTDTPANAVRTRSIRTVMPNIVDSSEINGFSEVQNEIVQHQAMGSKNTPLPYSSSSAMNYRTPDVCSRIFAPSTPCADHSLLSQDMFSSQLSSKNITFSTSRPGTVRKTKHISGF